MKAFVCFILFFQAVLMKVHAQEIDELLSVFNTDSTNLFGLTIQELLNLKITTASKTEQKAGNAPATIVVVTEEQISVRGYQSLLDVLRDLPDFKVDENCSSEGNRITVRGISGQEKFIIMLDGVRISSPTNEVIPVYANYPVNLAEQIEIIYGATSSLYGADAISGIINIITKKNKDNATVIKASSLVGTNGYSSNQIYFNKGFIDNVNVIFSGQFLYDKQNHVQNFYANEKDLSFDTTVYYDGKLNTKFGPIETEKPTYQTPMKGYNFYGAIQFKGFMFSGISTYSQNSSSLGYNTSNALYKKDAFNGRTVNMVNVQYVKKVNEVTFSSLLMGSQYFTNPLTNYQNVYVNLNKGYKYDRGSLLKAEEQIGWDLSDKCNVIIGLTVEQFQSVPRGGDLEKPVDSKSGLSGIYYGSKDYYNPNGIQAQIYVLSYNNTGLYSQVQYIIHPNLKATLGGRFDYNTRFGSTFNPRGGLVFNASKNSTLKLLYNQAYLAPSPYTTYQHYGSFQTADSGKTYTSNYWHLPNPNLKPIKSKNLELSALQFLSSNFSISFNSYLTFLSGLVVRAGDVNNYYNNEFLGYKIKYIETFENQGDQLNYGATVMLNQKIMLKKNYLKSYMALSYVDGKTDYKTTNDELKSVEIENIAPFIFRLGTDLFLNKFTFSIRMIAVGRQRINLFEDNYSPNKRQTISGYQLVNTSLQYNIVKKVTLFLNIDNVLNQRYFNISTGLTTQNSEILRRVPQNPIRFAVGLKLNLK